MNVPSTPVVADAMMATVLVGVMAASESCVFVAARQNQVCRR
mgnify:CR=1 FL=1